MMKYVIAFLFCLAFHTSYTQPDRWQQRIKYVIDVKMDVAANRFNGTEHIDYTNNSPDTLERVFFHLYWNAFQPNSMMDVRSRVLGKIVIGLDKNGENVYDWDKRVKDRIQNLKPDEIGFDSVNTIKINGIAQKLIYHETILEVQLKAPLLPHSKTSMEVVFNAQVPLQIRRSGRDNAEGIKYSISQWYPKMVEYDYQGWNANPYIAREFYGVWGDYDVNITIDKNFMLAGTGTIQNADEVGYGYQAEGVKPVATAGKTLTWKFNAQNVHDFVWAADPNYVMIKRQLKDGPLLYFIYKNIDSTKSSWQALADTITRAYPFIAKTFGAYPYKNYSFIQGGDGGMEYPMATLIKSYGTGGAVHEWMHSWYQGMMGTDESLYAWMDEGFTTYAELRTSAWLRRDSSFFYSNAYDSYFKLVKSNLEEPMSTHADHFNTNYAYTNAAYSNGAVFMSQFGYVVGDETLDKILLAYYNTWRFKHPNPNDFIRVAEKVSGIELQWYKEYWIYTNKTIDYALGGFNEHADKTTISLKRLGYMPMPVDVQVTYKDGTKELHYIPMNLMYGAKRDEKKYGTYIMHDEWKWTNPDYSFDISHHISEIKQVIIDPSMRLADVNRINNKVVLPD